MAASVRPPSRAAAAISAASTAPAAAASPAVVDSSSAASSSATCCAGMSTSRSDRSCVLRRCAVRAGALGPASHCARSPTRGRAATCVACVVAAPSAVVIGSH
eukprot:3777851-Pleurochrysis_carterae.AAC.2